MLTIVYSFNKSGDEAAYWHREIADASDARARFVPFNHGAYLDPGRYVRAQLLDNLRFARDPDLLRMYADVTGVLRETGASVLVADNCHPYHPEFLRSLDVYKMLRVADGPLAAYDRDFAYAHAYDHVLYHGRGYSDELTYPEKLDFVGARTHDLWPLAAFDALRDTSLTEETLFSRERDIDVVFVGTPSLGKIPTLARVMRGLRGRVVVRGAAGLKRNAYLNLRHGFPGWIRPIPVRAYAPLYGRAKIGFNLHNRGKFTTGNYRLFDLPANGVMQISDGDEYLNDFFGVGTEIVGFTSADDLLDRIHHYLRHDDERRAVAMAGFRRATRDHLLRQRMRQLVDIVERALAARRGEAARPSPQGEARVPA